MCYEKIIITSPNLVECFHDIEKADQTEWFCTSDPIGSKLDQVGDCMAVGGLLSESSS